MRRCRYLLAALGVFCANVVPAQITHAELNTAKQALILAYPRGFETPAQIAGRLSDVVQYGLPDSYFNNYIGNISRVTAADVNRVARATIDPSNQ